MVTKQQLMCGGCTTELKNVARLTHESDGYKLRYCSVKCLQQHHLLSYEVVKALKKSERSENWPWAEHQVEAQDTPCEAQCTLCTRRYDSQGEREVQETKPWYRGWCPRCIGYVRDAVDRAPPFTTTTNQEKKTMGANGVAMKPGREYMAVPVDEDLELPSAGKPAPPEEWVEITEDMVPDIIPGYQLSNWGRVITPPSSVYPEGKEASPYSPGKHPGHQALWLSLRTQSGRRAVSQRVDKLVLTGFVCPQPSPNHVPAHADSDVQNSRVDNLKWVHKDSDEEKARKSLSSARALATRRKEQATPKRGKAKKAEPVVPVSARDRVSVSRVYRASAVTITVGEDDLAWLSTKGPYTPQDFVDLAAAVGKVNEMNKIMGLI